MILPLVLLMASLVGPPDPRSKYDNLPEEPRRKPVVEENNSLVKALLPLFVAQGVDMISTEKPFGFLTTGLPEGNPLPGATASGFAGTASRGGWNLGEALLVAALMKANPGLGDVMLRGTSGTHLGYAEQNKKHREELEGLTSAGIPWKGEAHW